MKDIKQQALEILQEQGISEDDAVTEFYQEIVKANGMPFKKRPAKAQHRFKKELATIPFFVDYNGAVAEVYFSSRNEMTIKKGAKLVKDVPLNKDGSIGFGQRFALTLRDEQKDNVNDFVTIEDIKLKSPNEVGHFLWFAGNDPWKTIKDKDGKTLDEYTIVK